MRHWLLLCFALTGCPATDDQVVNTLTNMGFSEVDLLSCTDKATLQQKDAQIAELQKRVVQLEGADRDLVRYHMNQAEKYRNLAASRVSATPKARDDLDKLVAALSKHGLYPDDGARVADSLMQRVQRLSAFYTEAMKYRPVDDSNRVAEPLRALQVMKALLHEIAGFTPDPQKAYADGLAYQFGDEEASYLLRIDLQKVQEEPAPQIPAWLKQSPAAK